MALLLCADSISSSATSPSAIEIGSEPLSVNASLGVFAPPTGIALLTTRVIRSIMLRRCVCDKNPVKLRRHARCRRFTAASHARLRSVSPNSFHASHEPPMRVLAFKSAILFAAFAIVLSSSPPATAQHSASARDTVVLYDMACRYETEVKAFEKIVLRTRGVDRSDERLLDRFSDEISRLRLTAKNPRHFNRFASQWRQVEVLAGQVESTLFGKYTLNRDWLGQWSRVLEFRFLIASEFALEVENPGHENSVLRRDRSWSRRTGYFGAPADVPVVTPDFSRVGTF